MLAVLRFPDAEIKRLTLNEHEQEVRIEESTKVCAREQEAFKRC
jgi:hypothetical protein